MGFEGTSGHIPRGTNAFRFLGTSGGWGSAVAMMICSERNGNGNRSGKLALQIVSGDGAVALRQQPVVR